MAVFSFEEIVRRLKISPKELRRIADQIERELPKKTISEKERLVEEYKQLFLQQHNNRLAKKQK